MSADPFISFANRVLGQAKEFPALRAVVCDGTPITYQTLVLAAKHYATQLTDLGLKSGGERRVAAISVNSAEYVCLILACQFCGVAIVPLPGLVMADALARMLDDANVAVIFHDAESHEKATAAARLMSDSRALTLCELTPILSIARKDLAVTASFEPVDVEATWTSDFIYSSGTTGVPKGIVQSYASRSAHCISLSAIGATTNFKLLLTTGLYSNFGMSALMLTLWWGGTFFLMRKFAATKTVAVLTDEHVDMAWFAPATLVRTMEAVGPGSMQKHKSFVKLCAGAPLSNAQKRQVLTTWSGPFFDLYGQTETGTLTLLAIHAAPIEKFGSVGIPIPSVSVRIIDDAGRVLPTEAEGEIAGHSNTLMVGYHARNEANADAFWKDEIGRLYIRTGDIGKFDADGYLWLCDRKKDMIKSGGFNVYPADIERTLQDYPAVLEVAVVGFPSERWGETPVAFVRLRENCTADEEELKAWINARVGAIQRVAAVKILTDLPSGSMGKILKRELREKHAGSLSLP